ncbi:MULTISPECIES: glycosyl hydrolase family 18 protein [Pseudoalteromonas]|uniref:chitinase n=1 Tax=Pseudoalteromonas amylolytica TaxID=1859457 RepID=A0A1S1MPK6_9GAMM|nr:MULTISPECIES: glycosyl hydrolase family 18 protein [Pseudoalteromonas]OHU84358.1 chitinase [Pseudoalteromonas sp. JW3]OHU87103.1 chitinase [Pseudoalteromonas amylolytica]
MKVKQLTGAIALAMISGAVFAAPSTPSLSWEAQQYSFVDVNLDGTGSYKDLVQAKEQVNISIKWNAWSGDGGDGYKVYFDDMLVNEGTLPAGTKSGTIEFPYTSSGRHTLYVELCEGQTCARSAGKPIVIADTDGGHLDPLPMNVDPNNNDYGTNPNYVTGAYFVEWGIYGRNFDVTKIPAHNLSHLLYGFIPICGENESLKQIENGNSWRALQTACAGSADYEVVIHDPWAAVQKALPGVDSKDPIRGTYAQLMALKQRYPDLKILPSVGGWTLSDPFHGFTTKANRDTFVASMKKFLKTWKFYDGVDIDWEFPGGDGPNPDLGDPVNDGPAYVALMQELRAMLDELEAETGRQYELTSAIGSGYDKIEDVDYQAASQYMDYIFAMTYDFFGGWNNVTGHQTALYCGSHISTDECNGTGVDDNGEPRKGPAYSAHNAIKLLLAQGVDSKKLVMGAAMYGRGWEGVMEANATIPGNPMTAPGNGKFTGSTSEGVWEPGIMDYKGIVANLLGSDGKGINGFEAGYDDQAEAAYVWNRSNGKLLTYDSPRSVKAKGSYVKINDLGGLFAWEIDADNGDILNAMHEGLAGDLPPNRAPVVSVDSQVNVSNGGSTTVTATATDADRDVLTYIWTGDAALTLANTNSASVSVTAPTVATDTNYTLTVTVSDGKVDVSKDVTVTVTTASNNAPELQPIADVMLDEATQVSVSAVATDADNDTLTYTWDVPAGLTLVGSGANVSLSAGDVAQDTMYSVSVTVSDGKASVSESFQVTVKDVSDPVNAWDRDTVYWGGDIVVHQGKQYRAKWWTRGEEPGTALVWEAL